MAGMIMATMAGGQGSAPLNNQNVSDAFGFTFNTNGTTTNATNIGNWYTPTTTSIGNSYWFRLTGNALFEVDGVAVNQATWYALSAAKAITYNGTSGECTLEFSTNSAGTAIVGRNKLSISNIA